MIDTIKDIPWDRIVHFYGRASAYPIHLNALKNGTNEQRNLALNEIQRTIVHQDSITHVTPIALFFIFQLIKADKTNKGYLLALILAILKATNFQNEGAEANNKQQNTTVNDLLNESFLWPPFVSDYEDEILWEDYNFEPSYILEPTIQLFAQNKQLLQNIKVKNQYKALKDELLVELEKIG